MSKESVYAARLRQLGKPKGMSDTIGFGKHRGWTMRQLLYNDPAYIIWLAAEAGVNIEREIVDRAYQSIGNETLNSELSAEDYLQEGRQR
jgi:hypothetical protein